MTRVWVPSLRRWMVPNRPYRSTRPEKKRMVLAAKRVDGEMRYKLIHFGAKGYGHNYSPEARRSFRARHACATADDPFTASYWACRVLWAGPGKDTAQPPEARMRRNPHKPPSPSGRTIIWRPVVVRHHRKLGAHLSEDALSWTLEPYVQEYGKNYVAKHMTELFGPLVYTGELHARTDARDHHIAEALMRRSPLVMGKATADEVFNELTTWAAQNTPRGFTAVFDLD